MSYYTYFKLKEGSRFDNMTISEVKSRINSSFNISDFKAIIKASMVRWYYKDDDEIKERRNEIWSLVISYASDISRNLDYEYIIEAKEGKYGICRNRPDSEDEMADYVKNWDKIQNSTIEDLLILSCIVFEPDTRYSDTPKTTSDYLRYEYQDSINEILNSFKEAVETYSFYRFVLSYCDRIDEKDIHSDEEEDED